MVVVALIAGLIVTIWQTRVALRERDRAPLAQRQAERLDGFLEALPGSTDPSQLGKDVKVSQVLDAASQSIDRDLAAEPEVLIRAHQTLCRSYRHLGLSVPAEQHARAAFDLESRIERVSCWSGFACGCLADSAFDVVALRSGGQRFFARVFCQPTAHNWQPATARPRYLFVAA